MLHICNRSVTKALPVKIFDARILLCPTLICIGASDADPLPAKSESLENHPPD
jgi:hypothetical protein